MLPVFKSELEKAAPGQFDVEIHLNGTLFKQGTEPAAMQRGNLEMAMISAFDIAKQVPEWSIFTAGYLMRDPAHQAKVFEGEVGQEMYRLVEDKMGIKILGRLSRHRQLTSCCARKDVKTPADLAGVKLRMPGSDTWLFLGKALGANPPRGLRRDLHGAPDRGDRRPATTRSPTCRREVLRGHEAGRADRPSGLDHLLVDGRPIWDAPTTRRPRCWPPPRPRSPSTTTA